MPIRFRCPACQQVLSVSSRKAGQKVRCPACQAALKIPTPKAAPEESSLSEAPSAEAPETPKPDPEVVSSPTDQPAPDPVSATAATAATAAPSDEPVSAGALLFAGVTAVVEEDEEDFQLRRAQTEFEEMDLTPMVDVTFLLLIFFMITASFTMQKAIAFPPPSPEDEGASVQPKHLEDFKDECAIVEIHEDNSISIDDERIPLGADLAAMLASTGKNEMLIDAHENSLHETVVRVVDAGNEVQMQRIRLGTRGG
jgi:biopolymer transport protein ExbD